VNTQSDAESVALLIAQGVQHAQIPSPSRELAELQELIETTIHRKYSLVETLSSGVAFHYGNMPMTVKLEIERLFRMGVLQYLVCTSTLLEGVNLPCRNLFVMNPKKGSNTAMTLADFWNLAGRAGRWGKEFQGNVICIRTDTPSYWPNLPTRRGREPIQGALTTVLWNSDSLVAYIEDGHATGADEHGQFESAFSFFSAKLLEGRSLHEVEPVGAAGVAVSDRIELAVKRSLETIDVPGWIVSRHAGISPLAMQRFLTRLGSMYSPTFAALRLAYPGESGSVGTYKNALKLCEDFLGSRIGNDGRQWQIAYLIVAWMQGKPLARLIDDRYRFERDDGRNPSLPATIRKVMADVEQVARFRAPKYLACYSDLIRHHFGETHSPGPDVSMMLELGVNSETQVSLMALGLSRSAAIAVAAQILPDNYTPDQCRIWLAGRDIDALDLPALIRREIADARRRSARSVDHS
jgi:hypothetical protein